MIVAALASACLAMPQQAKSGDPFTRILNFESYQDGANFGHELFQEDGTLSGQKLGPDGLQYGFYSYLQPDGNRVKVFWRAGKGVGYEVIGVEGLVAENLGNLRATVSATTQAPFVAPKRVPTQAPIIRNPVHVRAPVTPAPAPRRIPVPVQTPAPLPPAPVQLPVEPTPAPHRFDYPAVLNLERTSNGFVSSLTAV